MGRGFRKSVQSVERVERHAVGSATTTRIYRKKRSSRAKAFRPLERVAIKLVKRQRKATDRYLKRHRDSNLLDAGGWVDDYAENVVKAYKPLDEAWVRHVVFNWPT